MVGFQFGKGRQRCIRQILEKYQEGTGLKTFRKSKSVLPIRLFRNPTDENPKNVFNPRERGK